MWDLENQHQWKKKGAIKTTWELENKVPSCKNITDSLAFIPHRWVYFDKLDPYQTG